MTATRLASPLSASVWGLCQAAILCIAWAASGAAWAAEGAPKADPQAAQSAWSALLGMADTPLRRGSGCEGDYGQPPGQRARLRDLLASQLAYMAEGQNMLTGRCAASQCELVLQRRNGEDVSSATISFKLLRHGQGAPHSLRCLMTP